MIGKRKLISIILLICGCFFLQACKEEGIDKTKPATVSEITSDSEVKEDVEAVESSEEKEEPASSKVLFIGKPHLLDENDRFMWISSDETIATVDKNVIIGLREGEVVIRKCENGEVLEEENYKVTTFNDGKQADICFEIGKGGFRNSEIDFTQTVDPKYLQIHINTIQDAITYFQESGFFFDPNYPILTSEDKWSWVMSGDAVLNSKCGGIAEIANAAAYLLQDDFEDWGFVFEMGNYNHVYNWFFEDGLYYFMDFSWLLRDFNMGIRDEEYKPSKLRTTAGISVMVENRVDKGNVVAVIMVSAQGHTDQPAIQYSYIRDSSAVFREPSVVSLEQCVYDTMVVLYKNESFDFTITSIPTEEINDRVPRYGVEEQYYIYDN